MRDQKKTHKIILGKGSQHSLGAVRDSDTRELHTDSKKTKSVQKFYRRLADPATSAGKTGAFFPEEAQGQYPWEHEIKDHFDIETSLQRELSQVSNKKTPGLDENPNELLLACCTCLPACRTPFTSCVY